MGTPNSGIGVPYTLTNEIFLGLGITKWFISVQKLTFFNRPSVYILLECNSNIQILQIVVHINYYIYLSEKSTVKKERINRSNSLDGEGWNSFPNSRSWYWPRYQSLCSKWIEIINLEQGRSNKSIIPDYNYRLIIFHNGNYCSITVY